MNTLMTKLFLLNVFIKSIEFLFQNSYLISIKAQLSGLKRERPTYSMMIMMIKYEGRQSCQSWVHISSDSCTIK